MRLLRFWCRWMVRYVLVVSTLVWLWCAAFDPLFVWWQALIGAAICAFFSWMLYPGDGP